MNGGNPISCVGPKPNDKWSIHGTLIYYSLILFVDGLRPGLPRPRRCISLATMDCDLDCKLQQTIFLLSCLCELFYHHSRKRKTSLIHNFLSLSFLHIAGHSQCWEVGQQVILRKEVLPSIGHIHGFPRPSSCNTGACSILQPSLADFQSHQPQKGKSTPWLQPKLTTVRVQ